MDIGGGEGARWPMALRGAAPTTMEQLAAEKRDHGVTVSRGPSPGWTSFRAWGVQNAAVEAAFGLETGGVSAPVRTGANVLLIQFPLPPLPPTGRGLER